MKFFLVKTRISDNKVARGVKNIGFPNSHKV